MDINYKILWFEDTDESYETLSRRTEHYVESKNLRCQIKRIYGVSDFDISQYDLNSYEVLVVDLQLSQGSKGYEIINAIRASKYVNDILFYSSAGVSALEEAMKEYRLEGVFLSDRNNRLFMEKLEQLVDKSVRRSENIINIRGIVMDETSEFDSQMKDIVLAALLLMTPDEIASAKNYISMTLLAKKIEDATKLLRNYPKNGDWEISDLLEEPEFTSMMRARLVNKILGLKGNQHIQKIITDCHDVLPEIFATPSGKFQFAKAYEENVIVFRNKLAHVKQLNAKHPVRIGTINGVEYKCDTQFCAMMRETLIRYSRWFDVVYDRLEKENFLDADTYTIS